MKANIISEEDREYLLTKYSDPFNITSLSAKIHELPYAAASIGVGLNNWYVSSVGQFKRYELEMAFLVIHQ